MEDVLEVYHRQYADNEVLVCLDETGKQQSLPSATTGGEGNSPAAVSPARGAGLLRLRIRAALLHEYRQHMKCPNSL